MVARMDGGGGDGNEQRRDSAAVSDEQLIAWHGEELSGQELAEREGLTPKWLYRQWDRLRRAGRIAPGGRSGPGSVLPPTGTDTDGRPRVGWYEDELLTRLIEVHGAAGRPDLVDVNVNNKQRRKKEVGRGGGRA